MHNTRGTLISLEGIEGSGKSTFLPLIGEWITKNGYDYLHSREPGGTQVAEQIRKLLLTPNQESISPISEFLLMAAARKQHLDGVIAPALELGKWVVLDRFADSSFAYQGYGREVSTTFIEQVHAELLHGIIPDLTLWFDISISTSRERLASRNQAAGSTQTNAGNDRFELLGDAFFTRVRQGFRDLHTMHPQRIVRIDAEQNREGVRTQVLEALEHSLQKRC